MKFSWSETISADNTYLLRLNYGHTKIVGQESRDKVLNFLHPTFLEALQGIKSLLCCLLNVFDHSIPLFKRHICMLFHHILL